jgi:dTDP-4-amino-4,6-dideoxygalactose transaminase
VIPIARPQIGPEEEAAILGVMRSGMPAQGEQVAAFERGFAEGCGVREAIAVSSGAAALHLALLPHVIGPGEEVITSPFSFAATSNTILLVGATPVFVDIDPDTYNLDPQLVERAITPRTKAIMPVHLSGNPADMDRLIPLAQAHNLAIIEDACQAHAAAIRGKPVGSFGIGAFPFYATKNITTGEGGAITTNDSVIAEKVRLLRGHSQKETYHHIALGYNLRMTDMQSAIGVVQLGNLASFTEKRIANAAFLDERLAGVVKAPTVLPGHKHAYHQYTIRVPSDRDAFARAQPARLGDGRALSAANSPAAGLSGDGFHPRPAGRRAGRARSALPAGSPALSDADLATIARDVSALAEQPVGR